MTVIAPRDGGQQSLGGEWALPNGSRVGTRAATRAAITSRTVAMLEPAWLFRFHGKGGTFGRLTSTPLVVGRTVYVQDTKSSVFALERSSGRLRWARLYTAPNDGPNGAAVVGDRVVAATDTTVFALNRANGRRMWSRRLTDRDEQFIDIAPVADRGRVYVSTVGFAPGGRGAIYALDLRTGRVRWKFETIAQPWPTPQAGGGGAWNPVSVDAEGRVYAGISNPGPWGGSKARPNGGAFRGRTLYTDSLVVLDGATGRLLWYDQVVRHDVRDYDFHVTPILARAGGRELVFGAGKGGRVVAWDTATRRRVWSRSVGTHLNDLGPLPHRPTRVCPGLFGGVLTPMALASGRLFVPVVELCTTESAVGSTSPLQRPPEDGRGVLVALEAATGRQLWKQALGSAPFACATASRDVVFVPTFDGWIHAFSARTGATLWRDRAPAGINGCPSVSANMLFVPAGAPHRSFPTHEPQLVAYRLR
jgi:outer membrane protein assembly factor BamB